jgi:hypothetical protein
MLSNDKLMYLASPTRPSLAGLGVPSNSESPRNNSQSLEVSHRHLQGISHHGSLLKFRIIEVVILHRDAKG